MIYLELFYIFLKIGAFTFGGGYAMLPLIQDEVIAHNWIDSQSLIDFIAVSEPLELEPESEYEVFIAGESAGKMGTNLSGKLSVSVELNADQSAAIKVVKC